MSRSIASIILNYRTAEMTIRAVEATLVAMADLPGEVIVVDNASGDESAETLMAAREARGWDRVRIIAHGRNGGFGAGNNVGMLAALESPPEFYYIQNSDAFPEPDALKALYEVITSDPTIGFAGSRLYGADGEGHQSAFRFPSIAGEFEGAARLGPVSRLLKGKIMSLPIFDRQTEVDWLAGASVMVRRATLEEIGLFDEAYFLYFEETDLFLRAHRKGWRCIYVPESRVMHVGGESTGMKRWTRTPGYWFDSRLHYFRRNHGLLYTIGATVAVVAGGSLNALRSAIQRRETGTPRRFLRDLLGHHLRSVFGRGRPRDIPQLHKDTAS